MRLASLLFIPALLALCPSTGFAQFQFPLVPFRQLPQDLQGWRTMLRDQGVQDGALYDEVSVHTETQAYGKRVAIITNVSLKPLFYRGYGGDAAQLYIEEMRGRIWLPNTYYWWEWGLTQQKLMPGQSCTLLLPAFLPGRRRCFWTVFMNKDNSSLAYLPWLFTPYDIYTRVTPSLKTSLVFLREDEG